jgi:hypothetical protein
MGPAGRSNAAMTADPVRGAMVLFGGNAKLGGPPVCLGDTWEHAATIVGGAGPAGPPILRDLQVIPTRVAVFPPVSVQIIAKLADRAGPGDVVVNLTQTGGPLMVLPGGTSQSVITVPAGQRQGGLQTTTLQFPGQYDFKATLGFATIVESVTAT